MCLCSAGLEALTLSEPGLPRLPAALASATALTSLNLRWTTAAHLAVPAEWEACLPPGLRRLALDECGLTDIPAVPKLSGERWAALPGTAKRWPITAAC